MGGKIGLSDSAWTELNKLNTKIKDKGLNSLTDIQLGKFISIKYKLEKPELPQGAKTYCEDWLKGQLYNRQREISSKYTFKGNSVEDASIEYISEQLGYGMLFKNEERFSNEHMEGEPDVVLNDTVIDAKNSWDQHSFPLFETEVPNSDYYAQGQVYMELTGKRKYKLIYTLMDTPEFLIDREFNSYCYQNNIIQNEELYKRFVVKMTYPDVPDHLKIKVFEFEYDKQFVESIYERVELCRDYIIELSKNIA